MASSSLDEAIAFVRTLTSSERIVANDRLALAVACGASDREPRRWHIFDPLECTPSRASQCLSAGRRVAVDGDVCLGFVERDLSCPFLDGADGWERDR